MKRLNKAFTLTELLVALGVIGILCAILLPVIFNILPNQNTIMAKRAYYTVQTVIADLINDEACYPDKTLAVGNNKRYGFDDGFGTPNCIIWGGEEDFQTIDNEGDPNTKFLKLYLDKLGLMMQNTGQTEFQTKDGMLWKLSGSFSSGAPKGGFRTFAVDVNGDAKPNCGQSEETKKNINNVAAEDCTGRTKGFDRFAMTIHADGKIDILDGWAQEAVSINKDITEE